MDETSTYLATTYTAYAKRAAGGQYRASPSLSRFYTYEEVQAEALYALTLASIAWPKYCAKRNPPTEIDCGTPPYSYWLIYLNKRIVGSLKDMQRRDDPYTRPARHQLNLSETSNSSPPPLRSRPVSTEVLSPHSIPATLAAFDTSLLLQVALEAYYSAPFPHRLATAYVFCKDSTDLQISSRTSTVSQATVRLIIAAVLPYLSSQPLPTPTPRQAAAPTLPLVSYTPHPEITHYLTSHSLTPAQLIQQFTTELTASHHLLLLIAERFHFARSRSLASQRKRERQSASTPAALSTTNHQLTFGA